ncbi:hypothetical protein F503_02134 [Ophiostoma piceae UAMH 11346]|uniref:Uncharacterized protein n=1 Tax=Ophiostoma piceae (strain UAMH 11346) TaxID=1262450 RepID=S3CX32_OPHP1|nr:hypothetical protein F503_02134 [Ophiostoma piceae UAMH 11346]
MTGFTRRQYDDACALLAPMLQQRCQKAMAASFKEDSTIEAALREVVFAGHTWNLYTTSVRGLALLTADVLSERYRMHLVDLASKFDRVSGLRDEHVSDTFMQSATVDYWVSKIVHAMAMGAVEAVDQACKENGEKQKEEKEREEHGEKEEIEKVKKEKPDPKRKTCPCAITDVHLSGPSIKEAWQANTVLRHLEGNATRPVDCSSQWSPRSDRWMPIYISTVAPFKGNSCEQSDIRLAMVLANFDALPRVVDGRAMANKLVPDSFPVVWTAYSPLRAFLWSLFHTEVITNTFGGADNTKRSWECLRLMPVAPHTHEGVVLITFRPDLGDRKHVFTVPKDRTVSWHRLKSSSADGMAADSKNGVPPADFWKRYAPLHKNKTGRTPMTDWPQTLHFYDANERAITKQAWQTAWHGEGIKTLNSACDSMMCISFQLTAAEKKQEASTGCCIVS